MLGGTPSRLGAASPGAAATAAQAHEFITELGNGYDTVVGERGYTLSGGQRQRIVIARALIMEPKFVICDESVSALDVSVQAQVLNLLNDLKASMQFSALFITHDLSVVKYISDRIMVMNQGKIEEIGPAEEVYHFPKSLYTQQLIAALP